jgi:peptidyl-prolyl cis-trans isomerase SurA
MRSIHSDGIKSSRFILCCSVLIFSLVLIFVWSAGIVYGITVDRVLATIGDEVITFVEYRQFVKGLEEVWNKDVVDEKILRKLVEERIIVREAKRKGLEASDAEVGKMVSEFKSQNGLSQADLESYVKDEGMSSGSYQNILRDKVLISKLIGDEVDSKVIIRDREIQEYYDKNRKEFIGSPENVELKGIFLRLKEDASLTEITDLKRRALKITAMSRDGYDFGALVDEYCDEPFRGQEGIMGKFSKGALIEPLNSIAFSLKEGEISDPIWVSDGAYILQLVAKGKETFKPLDEVREDIYEKLYKEKRDKLYSEWIKALWEKSSVIINQGS